MEVTVTVTQAQGANGVWTINVVNEAETVSAVITTTDQGIADLLPVGHRIVASTSVDE